MKSTIELPDELYRRVKAAAALRGQTLREFFTRATERELLRLETSDDDSKPTWHSLVKKPSSRDLEELERIDAVIEREFSAVDERIWQ